MIDTIKTGDPLLPVNATGPISGRRAVLSHVPMRMSANIVRAP
jgi:hypothetical protein